MPHGLTKLPLEDHRWGEKRSCKRPDNKERPKYQNVRVSFSSSLLSARDVTLVHIYFATPITLASLTAQSRCQCAQDQTKRRRACPDCTALGRALCHLPCLCSSLLRRGLLSLGCGLVGTLPCLCRQLFYRLLNGGRQLSSRDSVTVAHSEVGQPRRRADKSAGSCR